MGIKLGSTPIGKMYLGDTELVKAYIGDKQVYSSAPAIPVFIGYTNDLTGGKTYAASNENPSLPASNAFDNNSDSFFMSAYATSESWISVDFGYDVAIMKLRILPYPVMSSYIYLQGSSDNTNWNNVTGQLNANGSSWKEFTFENTTKYRYYRLFRPGYSDVRIYEIEMMAGIYQ